MVIIGATKPYIAYEMLYGPKICSVHGLEKLLDPVFKDLPTHPE